MGLEPNNEPEKKWLKDAKTGRFLTGNVGGGRPKGSRNLLTTQFLDDLCEDYFLHGLAVIEKVREQDPAAYLKLIVQVMPQKLEADITHNHVVYLPHHLSPAELERKYGQIENHRKDNENGQD